MPMPLSFDTLARCFHYAFDACSPIAADGSPSPFIFVAAEGFVTLLVAFTLPAACYCRLRCALPPLFSRAVPMPLIDMEAAFADTPPSPSLPRAFILLMMLYLCFIYFFATPDAEMPC